MASYLIRRVLLLLPTLIGMTALVFFVMALSGGNPADDLSRTEGARPEERRAIREYLEKRYGLDKPLAVQYLRWLNRVSPFGGRFDDDGKFAGVGFKKPDLGTSFIRHRPVYDLLAESLPVTLLLNVMTFPIVYTGAILMGIQAARKRGGAWDVGSGTVLLGMWSIPVIWMGVMLQGYLTSKQYIRLFPTTGLHDLRATEMTFLPSWESGGFQRGWLLDAIWHLALPTICLLFGQFAFLSKLSRGAMLESIQADFVRTARAKGVDEKTVLYQHVLRNSLLPLITVAARILPGMLAGALIVEWIFSLDGMGSLLVTAVNARDREVVLSITMISGFMGMLGYLLADIGYAIADPRVSYE